MKIEDVTDWSEQWQDVEFYDNIKIVGISRGRSSATFDAIWKCYTVSIMKI